MKFIKITVLVCFFGLISCAQKVTSEHMSDDHQYYNHLVNETSPYLLQHVHNPVDWYPWGEEALQKAKDENKLLLISIGYAACHWCHVMEHESFEDSTVASYMNEHFVCIKIDREERPDIDQVYMNAIQLLNGSGGWPLNCIAMPDGRPVYGGTYYPKQQWLNLLEQVQDFVIKNPEKAEEQANALTNGIQNTELVQMNGAEPSFTVEDLDAVFLNWKPKMDFEHGGNNRAPKFPMPVGYQFLLQYHHLTGNQDALDIVDLTLNKMADGGIYDQIGGGFARYSTDAVWKAPHFEKMLYDNGQLVSLYSAAFQLTGNDYYKTIIEESLGFVERELTDKTGGFYSSLDADSEGEEGKFYVWEAADLEEILGEDATLIKILYSVTNSGNWEEGGNILHKTITENKILEKFEIDQAELQQKVEKAKLILLEDRAKRIRPGLDDKILCSWNALMLKGYVDAYRATDNSDYLDKALKNANFIQDNMYKSDGGLYRNYKNGSANINGFLDDYSGLIQAYIALYQATFKEEWLIEAKGLLQYTLIHFYDESSGMFYYTSDLDEALIARKMEVTDNVIPASNSEMAKNLFILGQYFYEDDWIKKSEIMLNNVKLNTATGMSYYANWDVLLTWFASEPYEVAIVGKDCLELRKEFDEGYHPNVFLSGGEKEGSLELLKNKLVEGTTTIYVCQNKVCQSPTEKVADALLQIKN